MEWKYSDTITWTITRKLSNGKYEFEMENEYGDKFHDYYMIYDGELRYYSDSTNTNYTILLKEPLTVGNKWLYDEGEYIDTNKIVSIGPYDVQAGYFENCIKVHSSIEGEYMYYALDVGRIVFGDDMSVICFDKKGYGLYCTNGDVEHLLKYTLK